MGCDFWTGDDITACARAAIDFYCPLIIGLSSIVVLAGSLLSSLTRPHSREIAYPNLHVVSPSTLDRLRVAAESAAVLGQLGLLVLFGHTAKCLFWVYALVLVSSRILNANRFRVVLPRLWSHSTGMYFLYLLPSILTFRLLLISPVKSSSFYYLDFGLGLLLVLLMGTSSTGDTPAKLHLLPGETPLPEPISSLFSLATYSWINPMVYKAYRTPLEMADIWGLRYDDYAKIILQKFEASTVAASFAVKIFAHFRYLFVLQALWAVLDSLLVFAPSVLLKFVLQYVDDPLLSTRAWAWTLVLLMPFLKVADSCCSGCSLFLGRRVCLRMRAIIIGQVYAKALRRKIAANVASASSTPRSPGTPVTPSTVQTDVGAVATAGAPCADNANNTDSTNTTPTDSTSTDPADTPATTDMGSIINLMAVDAFKVLEICGYLHYFVSAVLMIIICICLLYSLLGWPALVGCASIVAILPINFKIAQWVGRLQKKTLKVSDQRIQMLSETFSSIRVIKFFAWENRFFDNLVEIRGRELHYLKQRMIAWCLGSFMWFVSPTLITFLSFYCYTVIQGRELTAPIAFTALSLFTLLRAPLDQLLDMTAFVIQSKVSLDRLGDFLSEPETQKYLQLREERLPQSPFIGFQDKATFAWNKFDTESFCLRDLDLEFAPEKLHVIVGHTGLGKTLLMLALLGEMDKIQGKVFLGDESSRVAYCAQLPWLINDTIRNNIVFSSTYVKDRYLKVVHACGLTRDLEQLPAGDRTEIGEKGIALSGGQKQRVSLARALYSLAEHVLLDDCLSAVDAHTAAWIYEHAIVGPLMEKRTCILVSHNVALTVARAHQVIVLESGRVSACGSPQELWLSGALGDDDLVGALVLSSRTQLHANLMEKKAAMTENARVIDAKLQRLVPHDEPAQTQTDGKLVEEEEKADGQVKLDVYLNYSKDVGGKWAWLGLVAVFALSQGIYIYQLWWLRKWLADSAVAMLYSGADSKATFSMVWHSFKHAASTVNAYKTNHTTLYYIQIYGAIGLLYAVSASFRVYITFYLGIIASNRIFKRVLLRILHAKLRFFDKTPQGRIMNRFSKDLEGVDQELTPFAEVVFICLVQCILTLILISLITPAFLLFAGFVLLIYYFIGVLYICLSRELKRFESITKLPIHQHFSESLLGVATIRAYGVEARFLKQNLDAIDNNNKPFFYLWVDNRWLAFRIDAAGSLVMFLAAALVLALVGRIDAGLAGLSLTYAISFLELALWIVRLASNLEMNMNSVERLQEYLQVEQEAPYSIPETQPPASWPTHGRIEVKDVSLRYAPHLPQVIKSISFDIEPQHKVGIVGRTGAGKSTIITAFFRFMEVESGNILIDGIDIATIGLQDLRQAMTIIPQDPTLFAGTIRSNLDPFNHYQDEQIFRALERVNLIGESAADSCENANKFLNLESNVAEGGGNLSQGERQLVCLARSLLKNPKIMLLDEATSLIDYKLDVIIQKTIREEFGHSTIITIAHRLRTIIDYDKILVMDAGRVVEYDSPHALISNKESLFYSMCHNSGELELLVKLAKQAYKGQ